jgi:magnesium chelatase family protein
MHVCAFGSTLVGVDGVLVAVEVDASGRGLPSFQIVGQGDRVIRESRDRIRAALRNGGLEFPPGRVTVNLVPTGLPKAGSALDLPIAIALASTRLELPAERLESTLLLGELGLDGRLHAVRGTLARLAAGQQAGLVRAVVPHSNLGEASYCPGIRACGALDLGAVVRHLRGEEILPEEPDPAAPPETRHPEPDLADVRGQETARRALEIAAAGGHNLLLVGPPGSGKTLLARRLPGLLPDLPFAWALEATRVHSAAGTLDRALLTRPPFRAPHHTTSEVGLIGGGRPLRPGEVSLAHRGVLFLDELPEFRRPALEALRQPLEEGRVRIVRAHGTASLAARFQLLGAMNPCPCGFHGDPVRGCECDDTVRRRYLARLSGPLLDRIDLHVPVPRLPWRDIASRQPSEGSAAVRARVETARQTQAERHRGQPWLLNAELPAVQVGQKAEVSSLLERAVEQLGLSMRGVVRAQRVARTIADLNGKGGDPVGAAELAEALAYRAAF